MKNSELAAIILSLPQDANATILFDGAVHADVDAAWLSNGGDVVIAARWEPVYDDKNRQVGAVTSAENPYLSVAEMMGLPPKTDDDDLD